MCICMYVCDSYNTQNGMEPIGGALYFNFLSNSCLFCYTHCFTDGYSMVDDSCGDLSVINNSPTL